MRGNAFVKPTHHRPEFVLTGRFGQKSGRSGDTIGTRNVSDPFRVSFRELGEAGQLLIEMKEIWKFKFSGGNRTSRENGYPGISADPFQFSQMSGKCTDHFYSLGREKNEYVQSRLFSG